MSERWSYEDLRNSGAIICEHISYPERPFSTPHETFRAEPEDSGWQFPCGVENHEHSRASVWALHEVADLDPSIRVTLDAAP